MKCEMTDVYKWMNDVEYLYWKSMLTVKWE